MRFDQYCGRFHHKKTRSDFFQRRPTPSDSNEYSSKTKSLTSHRVTAHLLRPERSLRARDAYCHSDCHLLAGTLLSHSSPEPTTAARCTGCAPSTTPVRRCRLCYQCAHGVQRDPESTVVPCRARAHHTRGGTRGHHTDAYTRAVHIETARSVLTPHTHTRARTSSSASRDARDSAARTKDRRGLLMATHEHLTNTPSSALFSAAALGGL